MWIGYNRLFPDIIGYFQYSFKIHELPDGKLSEKIMACSMVVQKSSQKSSYKVLPKLELTLTGI